MAARLIEVLVPRGKRDLMETVFKKKTVIQYWIEEDKPRNYLAVKLLTRAEDAGSVTDLLTKLFKNARGFRIIIQNVEATIPAVEAPEEPPPKVGRLSVSREELYNDVIQAAKFNYVFAGLMVISALIAAYGFLKDSTAIIIGSMVIAPLLAPNVAISLGSVLADFRLIRLGLSTQLFGVAIVLFLSTVFGAVYNIDPNLGNIHQRIYADYTDIVVAFLSGTAGILSFTTGSSTALIGVMVSISLLPPLVATGLLTGSGYFIFATGSFLLFLANLASLNLAGILTFVFQGVRPMTWWKAKKAKEYSRKALAVWLMLILMLLTAMWMRNRFLIV